MIINTNMAALNTIRQLGMNEKATQSSLAKLSSGYRINSAADDAAGLSISEKMRGQISGLNQASSNAQTGINLAATAEGALNTTTSILQRMRELAVQASNGTNTTADNQAMSDEFNQLKSAIDDIGNQTQFNTKNLLDGSLAGPAGVSVGQNATTGAVVGNLKAATVQSTAAMAGNAATTFAAENVTIDGTKITVNWQNLSTTDQATIKAGFATGASTTDRASAANLMVNTINNAIDQSGTNIAHVSGYVDNSGKLNIQSGTTGTSSQITTASSSSGILGKALGANGALTTNVGSDKYSGASVSSGASFNIQINGVQMQVTTSTAYTSGTTSLSAVASDLQKQINSSISTYNTKAGLSAGQDGYIDAVTVNATGDGRLQVLSESGPISFTDLAGKTTASDLGLSTAQTSSSSGGGMTFQIGANAGQTLSFGIDDMRTSALGLSNITIDSTTSAGSAITAIDSATAKVSAERSKLGAIQNRLEDTIDNLGTSSQNITTAEANIRDVDMAAEMTNFQKNNVLQQAAQAMLAQANQQPQAILQLLR